DPDVHFVKERAQRRPAKPEELALIPLFKEVV
ncbi:nitrite reductase [NAD(P)H], large subunit, partial [Pseudomonas savastanoi pv. glycinea str. race 4]